MNLINRKINYLDLFSGIGGFRFGLEKAGFRFGWTGHSETDKYACKVYHGHWPECQCLGDIRTIDIDRLPEIDIVTAGWPCQDLSIVGKRGGLRAKRSSLFFQTMQIIGECKPKVFILENVKGLFSSSEGRDFEIVLRTIADIGLYDCEWQLLNTRWFLPQNRERIYFIGHFRGRSKPKVFPIGEGIGESNENSKNISSAIDANYYKGKSRGFGGQGRQMIQIGHIGCNSKGQRVYDPKGIACSIDSQGGGQGAKTGLYAIAQALQTDGMLYQGSSFGTNIPQSSRAIRRLTPIECERLQGFPDRYTEGLSDNQRYKCLGNAVSVPVIEEIGKRLNTRTTKR